MSFPELQFLKDLYRLMLAAEAMEVSAFSPPALACPLSQLVGCGRRSPLSASAAPYKSKSHEDCPTKNPNIPEAGGSKRGSEQIYDRSARWTEKYEPNSSAD